MLLVNNITTYNCIIGVHLHGKNCTQIVHFLSYVQQTSAFRDLWIIIWNIKLQSLSFQKSPNAKFESDIQKAFKKSADTFAWNLKDGWYGKIKGDIPMAQIYYEVIGNHPNRLQLKFEDCFRTVAYEFRSIFTQEFFWWSSARCLNRHIFFVKHQGKKKKKTVLQLTPQGTMWEFLVISRFIFILITTLLDHRSTATTNKFDFKYSCLTSVGATIILYVFSRQNH